MTDSTVSRLHDCLIDALQARGHDGLDRPVTVAEIYQDLVPYRAVRSVLAVELNADYEHALLRLLAGEGNYVRIEPSTAREELRRELASPDPYVGLYRNFAACDVWISPRAGEKPAPARMPPAAPAAAGPSRGAAPAVPVRQPSPAAPPPRVAPAAPAAPRAPAAPGGAAAPVNPPAAAVPAVAAAKARTCAFCGTQLPATRAVHYCPFCGKDQKQRPCAKCGEVIQQGWRFCAACGTPVPGSKPAT